jgi:hypothetical protein
MEHVNKAKKIIGNIRTCKGTCKDGEQENMFISLWDREQIKNFQGKRGTQTPTDKILKVPYRQHYIYVKSNIQTGFNR